MKCVTIVGFGVLATLIMSGASAQDFVNSFDLTQIEKEVDITLKTGRSNVAVFKQLNENLSVTVKPDYIVSRTTGDICDRCTDYCRDYTMTLVLDGGLDTMIYSGRNCIVTPHKDPSSGPWRPARPLVLVSSKSVIQEDTLDKLRYYLTAAHYLAPNQSVSTSGLFSLLNEFRSDANLPMVSGFKVTQTDYTKLQEISDPASATECGVFAGEYIACGTLN
jgi:hypothetical protein